MAKEKIITKKGREVKAYFCFTCHVKFLSRPTLLAHIKARHLIKRLRLKCFDCCKYIYNPQVYRKHLLDLHSQKENFQCNSCPAKYQTWEDFSCHLKRHQGIAKPFICAECGRKFSKRSSLTEHNKTVHSTTKLFKCFCGKEFKYRSSVKKHLHFVHDKNAVRHICEICNKTFKDPRNHKDHVNKHLGISKYECEICHKKYSQRVSYYFHKRTQHLDAGQKASLTCNVCGQFLSTQRVLQKHMEEHNWPDGYKPFFCSICNSTFARRSYIRRHVKIVHKQGDFAQFIKSLTLDEFRSHLLEKIKMEKRNRASNSKGNSDIKKESEQEYSEILSTFECPVCKRIVKRKKALIRHLKNIHEITIPFAFWAEVRRRSVQKFTCYEMYDSYSCMICGERHTQKVNIDKHITRHHKREQVEVWCDALKKYIDETRHRCQKQVHGTQVKESPGKKAVPISPSVDQDSSDSAERTMSERAKELEFICPICDEQMHFRKSLLKHLKMQHHLVFPQVIWNQIKRDAFSECMVATNSGMLRCVFCRNDFVVNNKHDMNKHLKHTHYDELTAAERQLLRKLASKTALIDTDDNTEKSQHKSNSSCASTSNQPPQLTIPYNSNEEVESKEAIQEELATYRDEHSASSEGPPFLHPQTFLCLPSTCHDLPPRLYNYSTPIEKIKTENGEPPLSAPVLVCIKTEVPGCSEKEFSSDLIREINVKKEEKSESKAVDLSLNSLQNVTDSQINFPSKDTEASASKSQAQDQNSFNLVEKLRKKINNSMIKSDNATDGATMSSTTSNVTKDMLESMELENLDEYCCTKCQVKFIDAFAYSAHVSSCMPNMVNPVYTCNFCDKEFNDAKAYVKHRHECKEGKKKEILECPECNRTLADRRSLINHLKNHASNKPFNCHICGRGFCKKTTFNHHMQRHEGLKMCQCDLCGKWLSDQGSLKIHMRLHNGELPHPCPHCEKSFTTSGTLRKHLPIHAEVKPYICSVCNKGFTQSGHLRQHQRIHTGEKPHTCPVCNSNFSFSSGLKAHMQIHTGEMPHECPICHKKFRRKHHYNVHTHNGEAGYCASESRKRKLSDNARNIKRREKNRHKREVETALKKGEVEFDDQVIQTSVRPDVVENIVSEVMKTSIASIGPAKHTLAGASMQAAIENQLVLDMSPQIAPTHPANISQSVLEAALKQQQQPFSDCGQTDNHPNSPPILPNETSMPKLERMDGFSTECSDSEKSGTQEKVLHSKLKIVNISGSDSALDKFNSSLVRDYSTDQYD